jgi:hypothetical protein
MAVPDEPGPFAREAEARYPGRMTEVEWQECEDPTGMIFFAGPHLSERRLRLLACAAARRVYHLLEDEPFRRAIDMGERYADGQTNLDEGRAAYRQALELLTEIDGEGGTRVLAGTAATYACWIVSAADWEEVDARRRELYVPGLPMPSKTYEDDLIELTGNVPHYAAMAVGSLRLRPDVPFRNDPEEEVDQCLLVRDIIGPLPFRRLPEVNPAWLAWEGETVAKLAGVIYEERAFDRLPILADALEEAGCADEAVLSHLRGPGPHARGCWVLDLLLGKP